MIKKSSIFLMIAVVFLLFVSPVLAAEKHVSDCLDTEEDCLDDFKEPAVTDADDDTSIESTELKTGSLIFNIVKIIVALLLVLALIYLLLLFIKRKNKLFQQVGVMENIGGISVGQQKSIQIIRIGDTMYIVGVADNVELLQEITDEQIKHDLMEKKEATLQTPSFLQAISKYKNKKNHSEEDQDNPFTVKLQNELSKLQQNRNNIMDQSKKDDKHV